MMSQLHAVPAKAAAPEARTSAAPARQPAQSSAQPLRVFLVEDSALYRERLIEYLEAGCGLKVVGWADNEVAAVDALQRTAWDVAIVDVQLKQGTGLRVLRALHKKPRRPESRIVVLTNHDFYLYRRQAIEVGADLFFVKSRDFRHLAKVLGEMSSRRVASIRS
jgi:DNA-binding NarL/FixJ family response regulator